MCAVRVVVSLLALGLVGCDVPSQNVIVVHIEETFRQPGNAMRVRVCTDGEVSHDRQVDLSEIPEPSRVPIHPRAGDRERLMAAEVSIVDDSGRTLQLQRVFARFTSGLREIERSISTTCDDVDCPANETCFDAVCRSATVDDIVLTAAEATSRLSCCEPVGAETCDGTDEDCDGRVDEAEGLPSVCVAMGLTRVRDSCDDGSSPWNGASSDRSRLNRVVLTRPDLELVGGYMYLDGEDAAQSHRILIYDDDGLDPPPTMSAGAPGTLIAVSTEVVVPADAEPQWYFFDGWDIPPEGPLEPKQYWIGNFADGRATGSSLYNGCVVSAGDGRLGDDAYADGAEPVFVPRADGFDFQREIALFLVHAP